MREPRTWVRAALLITVVVGTAAGCGRVVPLPSPDAQVGPGISASPSEEPAAEATAGPGEGASATPGPVDPLPAVTALSEASASPCAGGPGADRVIAALRRDRNLLPAEVAPKIVSGPLCAGSWQYTVMNVPGREALQVVTRGSGGALTVVTAGTYVCIPEVVGAAPAGIVAAARCR
ncbi:hypothetical protein HC028_08755 [Planosporangium flavigriseum]|uniref:Lipoprotein n=1 Tax=Planosporangium flavigriseum TaxID=373681 RepID=A0A8J3LJQ1_9ACTN|nr:hypothetical protein [Planosporangium flavigriseum]NJC64594.1 hypothetical protein [Planosporangium flavigriseum]GIG71923.1 hypothetical protein Pfl04_03270 [Planosporangium flavigriseum]